MPVDLSIESAPDRLVEKLQRRAERHHRSLRSELLAILEQATERDRFYSPVEILAEVRRMGLSTPSESADMIRAGRDGRYGR